MQYFKTLPKIRYTDQNNVSTIYTNLMARANIIESMLQNSLLFYEYDVQDGDTPEIIAYKYYGDINRFWIVLYCNKINDPLWDWPLSGEQFIKFVDSKYGINKDDVHHYEKTVVSTNKTTGTDFDIKTTTETHEISEEEYNLLFGLTNTESFTFDTGVVTVTTSVGIVTNYEYENRVNESKRSIKLLNKVAAEQLENEFINIMK